MRAANGRARLPVTSLFTGGLAGPLAARMGAWPRPQPVPQRVSLPLSDWENFRLEILPCAFGVFLYFFLFCTCSITLTLILMLVFGLRLYCSV